ncbi:MAG: hypothetical protein RLZZ458_717 [Planctomycetota bacterium]
MALVTLTVLEGPVGLRGQTFRLQTPVCIGREGDGVNQLQLNDERVSRVHAKLQDDHGSILFTDAGSTNGSRINGHPVQCRVLLPGDHLQLGRCTLLFGTSEEIRQRGQSLGIPVVPLRISDAIVISETLNPAHAAVPAGRNTDPEYDVLPLFHGHCPPLPQTLTPLQRARLSDLLMYVHEALHMIIKDAQEAEGQNTIMQFPWQRFQNLLQIQRNLALLIHQVGDAENSADRGGAEEGS